MIRLLFIVPYPELREKVEHVISHHPEKKRLNADIRVMTVEDTPDFPADEYDAIIARGYTAQKTVAKYKQVPTIGLSISGYDMVRAISECCEMYHPKKVAVLGFGGQMYEVKNICRFFKIDVEVHAPVRHEELPAKLDQAIAAGCDALIGGYSANIVARQKDFPAVVIRTGEDTVLQAVDEAIHTVDQIRHQRIISQMYKTIIYSSKDGLLYVDAAGVIQVRNRVIRQMNGDISLMDRPLKQALPYLYKMFRCVVTSGQEESGRILTIPGTRVTVSVSCTPVIANKEISGVVFFLSDITMIQNLESQIRRKLSERGFQAKYTFQDIIHQSRVIDQTIETARRYAASDSNVIIVGETGTGKELFAQSIHNSSSRKNGPFVAINCAALPENLLESELFGYVEGAFTGTSKGGKMGLFEQAHGGTLFLDEVGEISTSIQSKLLRVLQERQVRRIGDNKVIDVNVRIISATNKSISKLSDQGLFRRDLVYRLDVLRLFLPPLRERENDVELLFLHLLQAQCRETRTPLPQLEPGALSLLHQYPFIGNIRELKNMVERASVLKTGDIITKKNLQDALYPPDLDMAPESGAAFMAAAKEGMPDTGPVTEPEKLRQALEQCNGNRTRAARLLGMDRSTLWRKMQKYQM
ncbi:sigma 54-interacting transcriptional regulator [Enterocloster aldenensis]|jgi:transcriptional regulator with PAS, ATPase and Fis domain|uniref:sigma 54-interacting transcriptional regulator n=1 Tax=Enterocloster aldenensis TaxID=358742 RepID=UPI000E529DED|nr:AAA family ATPase [Enterocloster aldenensis]